MNSNIKTQQFDVEPGRRLRSLRKEGKLTQEELAEIMECDSRHLGYVENGHRPLSEALARRAAKYFNVDFEYLMNEQSEKNQREKFVSLLSEAQKEAEFLNVAFLAFAKLSGYTVVESVPNDKEACSILDVIRAGCKIEKNGVSVSLSLGELNRFQNLLCDQAESAFKYLFDERGVKNG